MATINSLLFLFSTIAPNLAPPGNNFNIQVPSKWISDTRYGQNVLTHMNCNIGEHLNCTSHCQKNCSNYKEDVSCHDVCVLGCVCKHPFIRGPDGSCIMPDECPDTTDIVVPIDTCEEYDSPPCGEDEEVSCYAHCQRNCSNIDQLIVCPGEGPKGCVCKKPLIRGPGNTCIMPDQCPTSLRSPQAPILSQTACCKAETISCKSHCQKNCSNYKEDIPCPDICVIGCVCIEPFIRSSNGSCIMPYECPSTPETSETAGTTEEPDDIQCESDDEEPSSFPHCQRNCTNMGQMIVCPGEGPRGCVCKSPKIRGPNGDCITADECPTTLRSPQNDDDDPTDMKCPRNESISCFKHCEPNCTTYDKYVPCKMVCVQGCFCTPPLIRGPQGYCIMPEQCNTLMKPLLKKQCSDSQECDESDDEKDDDNENDNDINSLSGPFDNFKCDDENEEYKLCSAKCPDDCDNYRNTRRACKLICLPLPKCECKKGYVRGPSGNCIKPEYCSVLETKQCSDSQECDEKEDENGDENKNDNDINSRAVPGPFDNLKFCDGENEVFKVCSAKCPDDCDNYKNTRRACKLICLPIPKCECRKGYVRGPSGNCIEPKECPVSEKKKCSDSQECDDNDNNDDDENEKDNDKKSKAFLGHFDNFKYCDDENEVFKVCSAQCPDDCDNYSNTRRACKLICLPIPKCECRKGYVRGPSGNCIKPEDCPVPENRKCSDSQECGEDDNENGNNDAKDNDISSRALSGPFASSEMCPENEEYQECGTACQKTCRDYDRNIPCEFKCEPGCFCKENMVRGPRGNCILKDNCPPSGSRQPRKYLNMKFLPDFPKMTCKENEEFSFCAPFCPDDCSNYQEDRLCKRICVPGCRCIEGYVKGQEGTCIEKGDCNKENQCSDPQGCEENPDENDDKNNENDDKNDENDDKKDESDNKNGNDRDTHSRSFPRRFRKGRF